MTLINLSLLDNSNEPKLRNNIEDLIVIKKEDPDIKELYLPLQHL
jgi:hypothetical protein